MSKKIKKYYSPARLKQGCRRKRRGMSFFRLNICICFLTGIFFIGNLVMINSVTANGYKVENVESKLLELQNENQNLTINLSDKQSIESLMARLDELEMVEPERVSYITTQNTMVAKR